MLRTLLGLALTATLASTSANAQTLEQSPLVPGQPATLRASGLPPGALTLFAASFTGTGAGPCYLAGGTGCIGLLPPVYQIGARLTDGTGTATLELPVPAGLPLVPAHTQALSATAPLGQLQLTFTPTVSATLTTIDAFSTDFEGAPLGPAWSTLNPGLATVAQTGGDLVITPHIGGGQNFWYHDGEGVLVRRAITGDFTATAIVHAHAPGDESAPPALSYRLGGLLVRDPAQAASGTHQWAHIATGSGSPGFPGVPMAVENKTTNNSTSSFQIHPTPSTRLELRLQRRGMLINQFWRPVGGSTWTQLASYPHPGMATTVEVGMMAYSSHASPNVVVRFESLTFAP